MKNQTKHAALSATLTDQPAIYCGTYKKYNSGSIAGAWIDLTELSDADEFWDICKELHKDEIDPEFMFQDYQSINESFISESHFDAEKYFEFKEAIADLDEDRKEALQDFIDNDSYLLKESILDVIDKFGEAYQGQFDSVTAYAEDYVEQTGMLHDVPDNIQRYFDYESFGRDMECGGDIWISENGHVFLNF